MISNEFLLINLSDSKRYVCGAPQEKYKAWLHYSRADGGQWIVRKNLPGIKEVPQIQLESDKIDGQDQNQLRQIPYQRNRNAPDAGKALS